MKIDRKDRTSNYFIETTKQYIIQTGIESVSVRKIAEDSGYSYATIYNYFIDINDLLWATKKSMIQDLVDWMGQSADKRILDLVGIKHLFHMYIKYYFEYPNVFKFFYFYEVIPNNLNENETFDFNDQWLSTFNYLVLNKQLNAEEVLIISKNVIYAVHGLLMLHFSRNGELSYENACLEIDQLIDYLVY